jgi:hypothetical protein
VWTGGWNGTLACTTDATGTCSVSTGLIASSGTSETMAVKNLTLANATYLPAQNHDPEGDSTGTQITLSRPW